MRILREVKGCRLKTVLQALQDLTGLLSLF